MTTQTERATAIAVWRGRMGRQRCMSSATDSERSTPTISIRCSPRLDVVLGRESPVVLPPFLLEEQKIRSRWSPAELSEKHDDLAAMMRRMAQDMLNHL